jgi:K+/H+ antiporter YhaU regulatory subunit KhtT
MRMRIRTGRVVQGQIVLKDGAELEEGEVVTIVARDAEDVDGVELSAEEEDELVAAMAEADRGELVDADEVFAQLRARNIR